jgi:pimeloyl-ACP methyl ester carboxylesterase
MFINTSYIGKNNDMKLAANIFKRILIVLFAFGIITLSSVFLVKIYNRHANRIISKDGIEYEGFININGYQQWICVRGENKTNPIILFIHGGPGSPESGMGCKKYQGILEKSFTMVHWEQRGAGKSYNPKIENDPFIVDTFVNDVISISEFLRKEYNKKKIFLIGHSWGSIIGIEAISKRPNLYYSYIGFGQIVNAIEQERISRLFVMDYLKKTGKVEEYIQLENIGEPPYKNIREDLFLERKYLRPSGGWIGPKYSMSSLVIDALFCPYYSFVDYYRIYKGVMYSLRKSLTKEYWDVALDKSRTTFQIPVFFISGEYDYNTPVSLVDSYYNQITAPQKDFVRISQCGHLVNFENPIEFNNEVVRLFLKVKQ